MCGNTPGLVPSGVAIGFYGLLSSSNSVAEFLVEAVDGVGGGLSKRCLQRSW